MGNVEPAGRLPSVPHSTLVKPGIKCRNVIFTHLTLARPNLPPPRASQFPPTVQCRASTWRVGILQVLNNIQLPPTAAAKMTFRCFYFLFPYKNVTTLLSEAFWQFRSYRLNRSGARQGSADRL